MGKLENFLAGRQILEEKNSPINGKLTVVRELAWGTHIQAGGITQSGGIAQDIWKTVFRRFGQKTFRRILIVGLGGGGIAKLVFKNWPKAKIYSVEIDSVIVELGKTYLGLDKIPVKIAIEDGLAYCKKALIQKQQFDLVCVDTYVGQTFPKKFASKLFLTTIKGILSTDGTAIFNRLYYKEKVNEAHEFKNKLVNIFPNVEDIKPEANIMFMCSKK